MVGGNESARGVVSGPNEADEDEEEMGRREGVGGGRTPRRSSFEREDWRRLGGGVNLGGRRSLVDRRKGGGRKASQSRELVEMSARLK